MSNTDVQVSSHTGQPREAPRCSDAEERREGLSNANVRTFLAE